MAPLRVSRLRVSADPQVLNVHDYHCLLLRREHFLYVFWKEIKVLHTQHIGTEYFELATSFNSKNHQGGTGGREKVSDGRIQQPRQVAALKQLLSKLHPKNDRLVSDGTERTKAGLSIAPFQWSSLGKNTLAQMMRRISDKAKLLTVYTNHCVRATAIQRLVDAGLPDTAIIATTGHKQVQSLVPFATRNSDTGKSEMAAIRCWSSGHRDHRHDGAQASTITCALRHEELRHGEIRDGCYSRYAANRPIVLLRPGHEVRGISAVRSSKKRCFLYFSEALSWPSMALNDCLFFPMFDDVLVRRWDRKKSRLERLSPLPELPVSCNRSGSVVLT